MIAFLTSSPSGPLDGSRRVDGLDPMNHFIERLRDVWPDRARCLMISAFPEDIPAGEEMTGFFRKAVEGAGLRTSCFDIWDCRTPHVMAEDVNRYQVIFLGGGHVPTQNRYFASMGLADALRGYHGVLIGISAGSMNAAALVYCQPEEPGEAVDPGFNRWIRGLGITRTMILPHYQMVKDRELDGMSLYREITATDSIGHRFLLLTDGAYLLRRKGREMIYGESYVMENGEIRPFCADGEERLWNPEEDEWR